MDFLCWLHGAGKRIWGFFAKPIHQSLTLIWLTVFVLGAQLAIVCTAGGMPGLAPAYVILLLLFMAEKLGILLREIKETPNDGPKDLPPTDG